jgi:hypothetical protein
MAKMAAAVTIVMAILLQSALCLIQDEDPTDSEVDADTEALAQAKDKAGESAKELAAAVSEHAQSNAKAATSPVVQAPTAAAPATVTASKPTIGFSKEEQPLLGIIKNEGLKNYDIDGSNDLNMHEFRSVVHDLNPVDPIAISDSEVERLLKTYDTNHDEALSQEEIEKFLDTNPATVAKMNVMPDACNGWSPKEGPHMGKGSSCQKWDFQVNWCWIDKDFSGTGKGRKQESDEFPGKWFAPCTPAALPATGPTSSPTAAPDKVTEKATEALALAATAMKEAEEGSSPAAQAQQ